MTCHIDKLFTSGSYGQQMIEESVVEAEAAVDTVKTLATKN